MSYDKYLEHIDTTMGADTPIAFGLHPNAEIDFRTQQSDSMFKVGKAQRRLGLEQNIADHEDQIKLQGRPYMPLRKHVTRTWGPVA